MTLYAGLISTQMILKSCHFNYFYLFHMLQGSNLDSNAKMWRLVADLMNDLGRLFDTPSFHRNLCSHFVYEIFL